MSRKTFIGKFSKRLTSLLIKEGYISSRSKCGVEIKELAEVAGVSYQMARKYLLGMALPDYHIVPKIAKWLNVSAGWLLFGDNNLLEPSPSLQNHTLEIDMNLLRYILFKSFVLLPSSPASEKVINFIISTIYDASHLQADIETIHKMIDLMIASAINFSDIQKIENAS